jgi:hypothetical protein
MRYRELFVFSVPGSTNELSKRLEKLSKML